MFFINSAYSNRVANAIRSTSAISSAHTMSRTRAICSAHTKTSSTHLSTHAVLALTMSTTVPLIPALLLVAALLNV